MEKTDQSLGLVSSFISLSLTYTQTHTQSYASHASAQPSGWGNYLWWKWAESVNTCLASFEKTNISLLFLPSSLWGIPTPHLHPPPLPYHNLLCVLQPKGEHKSQDTKEIGVKKHTQTIWANVWKGETLCVGVEGPGVLWVGGRANTIPSLPKGRYDSGDVTRPWNSCTAPPVSSHRCFCLSGL